ncbi:hypothetical protein ABNP39_23285 (plasmid) [Pantoea dispersa]|uniref:Uncharacterized protein n=1 Tax=Pantoea dispersa TaxID=59814 RepID=A0ABY2ZT80_9GAMM|nr:hypothetical protein [Pantoea dispersa]TQC69994.1 hypothetical protein FK492_19905 [Pantoea dispersa]
MSTAENDFYLSELDRQIFSAEQKAVNLKLERLVEEYARLHGGYANGLAELGEYLLHHADYLRANREGADCSWTGLMTELKRRSG